MGPKDDASAKPAEIGNALVEALGFEPSDGKDLGQSAVAQASTDVSDQLSELGFTVTEAFDGGDDDGTESADADVTVDADLLLDDDVSLDGDGSFDIDVSLDEDSSDGSRNGKSETSSNGKSGGESDTSSTDRKSRNGADLSDSSTDDDSEGDGDPDDESSVSSESKGSKSKRNGSATDPAFVIEGDSTDGSEADYEAKLKSIGDGDPNDTVVMPGPPDEDIAAAIDAGVKSKDKDDLVESLVAAGTISSLAPTSPPFSEPLDDIDFEADTVADVVSDTAVVAKSDPLADPDVPTSPAVTGEHPAVDVTQPAVEERSIVVDSRSVIDKPKSISDMFSGGITGRRRLQARKVRRVIRHIDPWSVLTFSVLFHLCLFAALLLASVLVWNVAAEAGTIENMESFIRELGDYETFEIDGEAIFRAAVAIAGIMTLAASVLVVLLTVMFNLLSDLLGGVRVTVIEEETIRVKPKKTEN